MSATVHDQGYRAFDGVRRPPSANLWVLARQGRRRALAPVLVKLTLLAALLALLVYPLVFLALAFGKTPSGAELQVDPVSFVRGVFDWQVWFFSFLVTLSGGAGAISEDVRSRAFQYYFAKPVTPAQYAFGRMWPIAEIVFFLAFAPAAILSLLGASLASEPARRVELLGLLFPSFAFSVLVAAVLAVTSVAASALGRSRALTLSTWAAAFLLPSVVASIVEAIAKTDWLRLASIPACLDVVGDALFRRAPGATVRWPHALAALAVYVALAIVVVRKRLSSVETVG